MKRKILAAAALIAPLLLAWPASAETTDPVKQLLETKQCPGCNLLRANLSGADLTQADLSGANLIGANLSGANLSGANLSEANLGGANLLGADLSEADLSGAQWPGAQGMPPQTLSGTGVNFSEHGDTGGREDTGPKK